MLVVSLPISYFVLQSLLYLHIIQRCNVLIPLTILFRAGTPYKGLDFVNGSIRRVNLDELSDNHRVYDSRKISGAANSLIRVVRSMLIEFAKKAGYAEEFCDFEDIDEESLICSVVYVDGERENLSLRKFDLLIRNESWRRQAMFLQGYVPATSTQSGFFGSQKKVRSLLDSDGAEAADQYTKSLAKFVERAYSECTSELVPAAAPKKSSSVASSRRSSLDSAASSQASSAIASAVAGVGGQQVLLKVVEMNATFVLDKRGRLYFLQSDYTTIEIQKNVKEVEEVLVQDKSSRENSAAESIYNELQTLLRRASNRGLSIQDTFKHFNTQRTGFVDVDGLMNGMAKLGIGVTFTVGEKVLQLIGGIGSDFLTIQDFERFINVEKDLQVFEDGGFNSQTRRKDLFKNTVSGEYLARQKELSQLLPPPTTGVITGPLPPRQKLPPVSGSRGGHARGRGASSEDEEEEGEEEEDDFPSDPSFGLKPGSASVSFVGTGSSSNLMGGQTGTAEIEVGAGTGSREGAVRQTSVKKGPGGASKVQKKRPLTSVEEAEARRVEAEKSQPLPPWATKRQKRALKELQNAVSRSEAKRQKEEELLGTAAAAAAGADDDARMATSGTPATPGTSAGRSVTSSLGANVRKTPIVPPFNTSAISGPDSRSVSPSGTASASRRPGSSSGSGFGSLSNFGSKDLKGISLDPSALSHDINKDKDEILYVDYGMMMTYRLVLGAGDNYDGRKTHEELQTLRYKSILEGHEKSFVEEVNAAAEEASGGNRQMSFTLVVVPDLFMTLETLEVSLDRLLDKFPHARLVLVGVPGLPNTNWPPGFVLNSDIFARAMSKLLMFLHGSRNQLVKYPGDPIFMMGIGVSVYTVSRFIVNHSYKLGPVRNQIRAIFAINGYLKLNGGVKRICKELRDAMVSANSYEVNELIVSLHFYDEYLIQNGREEVLKKFWACRRGLCSYDVPDESAGRGYVGVLEHLNGIMVDETAIVDGKATASSSRSGRKQSMSQSGSRRQSSAGQGSIDGGSGSRRQSSVGPGSMDGSSSFSRKHSIMGSRDSMSSGGGSIGGKSRRMSMAQKLDGILGSASSPDAFDGTRLLADSNIPIIVVQSTEDVFIDPRNVGAFKEMLPANRKLVNSIDDIYNVAGAIQINYLAAGHEVIQERNGFILGLVTNAAMLCGINPLVLEDGRKKNGDVDEEIFDVLVMAERRREQIAREEQEAKEQAKREEQERKKKRREARQLNRAEREEEEREQRRIQAEEEELQRAADEEKSRLEGLRQLDEAGRLAQEVKDKEDKDEEAKRERQIVEREKRAKLALERKQRELKAARKAEMEVLYEKERLYAEQKLEAREILLMEKEDSRSVFAREYHRHCMLLEESNKLAAEKAQLLHEYRREEAVKKVEENLARARAARMEERRLKAASVVAQLEAEELTLSGEKNGGYDPKNPKEVNQIIVATQRLLKDLMECRQKCVEAMKRQRLILAKVELFRKQCYDLDTDVSRLRRAVRLVEINPSLVVSQDPTGKEQGNDDFYKAQLEDLKRNLASKEESYLDFLSVKRSREEQLEIANRTVQKFKLKQSERDQLMRDRLHQMGLLVKELSDKIRNLKMSRDNLTNTRNILKMKGLTVERRIDAVMKEWNRIKHVKEDLVDTDVWIEGVLQRARTKELRKHLESERDKSTKDLDLIHKDFDHHYTLIVEAGERIGLAKRDCDKLSLALKSFTTAYKKVSSFSVNDLLHAVTARMEKAQKVEDKKEKDALIAEKMMQLGAVSQAEKVRVKDHELRSKDDRQFIGLDIVLNPEKYLHLSITEAEEMQYDQDYQCELTKPDLERIQKLPVQINLAMPFLHTETEIRTHRLFNLYYRDVCIDDDYFRKKDFYSAGGGQVNDDGTVVSASIDGGDGGSVVSGLSGTVTPIAANHFKKVEKDALAGPKEMQESEAVHDIIIKESLRDRIRAITEDEPISEDEQAWLQLDKILSPEAFGAEELTEVLEQLKRRKVDIDVTTTNNEVEVMKHRKPDIELSTTSHLNSPGKKSYDGSQLMMSHNITESEIHPTDLKKLSKTTLPVQLIKENDAFNLAKRDGDKYSELRYRYDTGEKVFSYDWKCPFNLVELLEIRDTDATDLRTDDQMKVKLLMEKYYVDPNESVIGAMRLKTMNEVTGRLNAGIKGIEMAHRLTRRRQSVALGVMNSAGLGKRTSSTALFAGSMEMKTMEPLASLEEGSSADDMTADDMTMEGTLADGGESFEGSVEDAAQKLASNRIWGSWEQVHPASAGLDSQMQIFQPSVYTASRDHPASYAMSVDPEPPKLLAELDELSADPMQTQTKEDGIKTLLAMPKAMEFNSFENDSKSIWFITESITELGSQEQKAVKGKVVLIAQKDKLPLLEVTDSLIDARQSRIHRFVVPDREDARILDITVSIVYQGTFGTKGYKVGRLAAALFRLPSAKHSFSTPQPIGFSPYDMQSSNLPESLGRVTILHQPKIRPIVPGPMQIVVGSASTTKYSIEVSARYAKAALPIVDEAIIVAKTAQARFPKVLLEIEALDESLRLAERKLLVCDKMILEAQAEAKRVQERMYFISDLLEKDDEDMTMLEDERKEYQREYGILEVEYSQFSNQFASRHQEKIDIREGIAMMHDLQRQRQAEKKSLKVDLENYRRDLPSCMALLRSLQEASNVAAALNTSIQGPAADSHAGKSSEPVGLPKMLTPAETVRATFKRDGWDLLELEHRQWIMLDQALNPVKYEWLREQEEAERQELLDLGKKPKKKKYNAAIEAFMLSKTEIQHILRSGFATLNRREVVVRKLLTKYHDDPEIMARSQAIAAHGFDPHIAERVRAKNPKAYSKEEQEWSSVDRVLHPEIWKHYVHIDEGTNFAPAAGKVSHEHKGGQSTPGTITRPGSPDVLPSKPGTAGTSGGGGGTAATSKPGTAGSKNDQISSVGRILGLGDMGQDAKLHTATGTTDMNTLLDATQTQMIKSQDSRLPWKCHFTKDQLMKIWRTPRHVLTEEIERHAHKLLHKYNGTYQGYIQAEQESGERRDNGAGHGKHIQWNVLGNTVTSDVDLRTRILLREIDRVSASKNEYMDSEVLHAATQRFPTTLLRVHLEEELDFVLREQVKERERSQRWKIDDYSDEESDDDEGPPPDGGQGMDDDEDEVSDLDGDVDDDVAVAALQAKVAKRAKKREKRRKAEKADQGSSIEDDVFKMRKMLNQYSEAGEELEAAILQNALGRGGCIACRTNPCSWKPCVDVELVSQRKKELDKELERVRLDRDSHVITSDVCLSAHMGGNRVFKRMDLLDELNTESRDLDRRLQLNNVDRELHNAYSTRSEYIEIEHLHGYKMMMWTSNARVALESRQSKLVAMSVAKDVIDSMLDYMLEGWFFGETKSTSTMIGYVPSIKDSKDGNGKPSMMRPGADQIDALELHNRKLKARADLKKKGIASTDSSRGTILEKAAGIEETSQTNIKREKVAKKGSQHEHLLNETESTLRFGLFMLTFMYFRAMTFVRREKVSWSGESEMAGLTGHGGKMTDERMRMLDEENKAAARKKKIDQILAKCKVGEQRRKDREAAERQEAIFRLAAVIRRQKTETAAVGTLQRMYRGHLGRKAAKRWALKRAEINAMHFLLNSTAICLQRVWRGYLGREYTVRKRREMAYFIALMRQQEAEDDEELYWQTHPWSKLKRDNKDWMDKKLRKSHQVNVLGGSRLTKEEQDRQLAEAADAESSEEEESDDDFDARSEAPSNTRGDNSGGGGGGGDDGDGNENTGARASTRGSNGDGDVLVEGAGASEKAPIGGLSKKETE